MRVAASSAAWVGAGLALLAFGVGFLVIILPIARAISIGLMVVCFVLAAIAFYGAYRAHYHPEDLSPVSTPTLPSDSATIAALRAHTAALRDANSRARMAEVKALLSPARTISKPEPQPQTFGNLKPRTLKLANDILVEICKRGWEGRECQEIRTKLNPAIIRMIPENDREALHEWANACSRFFMREFYDDVHSIRDEFAQIHLRDRDLDSFISSCESSKESERIQQAHGMPVQRTIIVMPQQYFIVADSLNHLAAQVS